MRPGRLAPDGFVTWNAMVDAAEASMRPGRLAPDGNGELANNPDTGPSASMRPGRLAPDGPALSCSATALMAQLQ